MSEAATLRPLDRDHFVRKFEAIPEHRWCTVDFTNRGRHCALGHCGAKYGPLPDGDGVGIVHTPESRALVALFSGQTEVAHINDGIAIHKKPGAAVAHLATPRARILAALRAL